MQLKITRTFHRNGSLADPDYVALSDSGGAYGVRNAATEAVAVAAGTAMVKDAVGVYSVEFAAEALATYEYVVAVTVGGATSYFEGQITAAQAAGTLALSDVADWLKIESTDDWPALTTALIAAEQYVTNVTGKALADCADSDACLWRVAVMQLAGIYFENREGTAIVAIKNVPFALSAILAQLTGITP